eukprot:12602438-Ditylum_brightwellii.AAC.1
MSGTLMSGCFSWSTAQTGFPVLVHSSSGKSTPPPVQSVAARTASLSFPDKTVLLYRLALLSSSLVA